MCCNGDYPGHHDEHGQTESNSTGDIVTRFGRPTLSSQDIVIDAVPSGPSVAVLSRLARGVTSEWLRRDTAGADLRLLSLQLAEPDNKERPGGPERFVARVYDYTNNRTLCVCGLVDQPERASVSELATQPLPNDEEFGAAVEMLANQSEYGGAIRSGELLAYRPMPPLVQVETPDGRVDRTLTVGLVSRGERGRHHLVGVNLIRREILDRVRGAAHDSADECGPPASGECSFTGTTGRVSVTVSQGGTTLWQFDVVRPAASSGTNGSGIELRAVRYRGKQVLYQAHVPILNVEYFEDGINAGCRTNLPGLAEL